MNFLNSIMPHCRQIMMLLLTNFLPLVYFSHSTIASNSTVTIGAILTNVRSTRWGAAEAISVGLAADAINSDPSILPNHEVKVEIYDDSASVWSAQRAACSLARTGVHSIVGMAFSSVASHLSRGFCSAFQLPCISHSATSPPLSDRVAHPFFGRVTASDSFMARGIVEVAYGLDWQRVCVIHEESEYGIGGAVEVLQAAREKNVDVITIQSYPADIDDGDSDRAASAVHAAKSAGCRIFVLYCLEGGCSAVLEAAREAEVVDGRNFGWILADGCASALADSSFFDAASPRLRRDLIGTICIVPSHRRQGPGLDRFMDAYEAATEGRHELGDANDINPFAMYAYDAVVAATRAIHAVPGAAQNPLKLTGDEAAHCLESVDGVQASSLDFVADVAMPGDSRHWTHGKHVMQALSNISFVGATSGEDEVRFTDSYEPASAHYSVLNLQEFGVRSSVFLPVGNITVPADDSPVQLRIERCAFQFSPDSLGRCQQPPSDTVKRTLRVLTCLDAPPFVMFASEEAACTEACKEAGHCPNECYTGVAFKVFKEVLKNLNDKRPVEYVVHHRTCAGHDSLIRDVLVDEDFDIFVADATATAYRSDVVDVSSAFIHTGLQLLRKQAIGVKKGGLNLHRLASPFTPGVWVLIIVYLLAYCCCFYYMGISGSKTNDKQESPGLAPDNSQDLNDKFKAETSTGNKAAEASQEPNGWWLSFYWGLSSIAQNSHVSAATPPAQLLDVGFSLCNLVLISAYTANLAAILFARREEPMVVKFSHIGTNIAPFQSICLQNRGGSIEAFYNQSFQNKPEYRSCYNCDIPFDNWNITTALESLCSGKCKYIIGDADTLHYRTLTDIGECKLEMSGDRFYKQEYSFMLKKNDPFTSVVSAEIMRLRESLVIDDIEKSWLTDFQPEVQDNNDMMDQLGLQEMAGVFMLAGIFLVLAWLVYLPHRRKIGFASVRKVLRKERIGNAESTSSQVTALSMGLSESSFATAEEASAEISIAGTHGRNISYLGAKLCRPVLRTFCQESKPSEPSS